MIAACAISGNAKTAATPSRPQFPLRKARRVARRKALGLLSRPSAHPPLAPAPGIPAQLFRLRGVSLRARFITATAMSSVTSRPQPSVGGFQGAVATKGSNPTALLTPIGAEISENEQADRRG
jgi:hypothetical protein